MVELTQSDTSGDSQPYFTPIADQWDEIRTGYFTEHMRDSAITKANLSENAVVADIGTGTGFVAAVLARRAAMVYGFDANGDMLEVAKKNLAQFDNVKLKAAPRNQIPLPDGFLDGVFANMYLHHASDPAKAIQERTRVLMPGGVVCITELDAHDHE